MVKTAKPVRKTPTPRKRKGDDVLAGEPFRKRVTTVLSSDDDDDDATGSHAPAVINSFLENIHDVKKNGQSKARGNAEPIKEALVINQKYEILDISEVRTKYGMRQIWEVKGLDDGVIKQIWSCTGLHRFTTNVSGALDPHKASLMKEICIVYQGYESLKDDVPTCYMFDFVAKH